MKWVCYSITYNMNPIDDTSPLEPAQTVQATHTVVSKGALYSHDVMASQASSIATNKLDRFEVIKLLGAGGMGKVYLAREPVTDTKVAIKVMKPQFAGDPKQVHRFLTEARHMYQMQHSRILRVMEVVDREDGPYYVMPYIDGGSLCEQYKRGNPLPTDKVLNIAQQIAEALAYAHSRGIIHRDLKPANIMLDKDGHAYLADFGLVRTLFNDSMLDASDNHIEGTVPYMSPAVARGEVEDTRCDIYAFGAVLYELLTGRPPYMGRTPLIVLEQVRNGPPQPIREVNPKADPTLISISEGCMARELRDRYATMADVVLDLQRAEKGLELIGVRHDRGHKWVLVSILLVGIIMTMGVVGSFMNNSKKAKAETAQDILTTNSQKTKSKDAVTPMERSEKARDGMAPAMHASNLKNDGVKSAPASNLYYQKLILTDAHSVELMGDGTYGVLSSDEPQSVSTFWLQPVDLSTAHEIRLTIQSTVRHDDIGIMLKDHGLLKSDTIRISQCEWKADGNNKVIRIPASFFKTKGWDMKSVKSLLVAVVNHRETTGFQVRLVAIEAGFLK